MMLLATGVTIEAPTCWLAAAHAHAPAVPAAASIAALFASIRLLSYPGYRITCSPLKTLDIVFHLLPASCRAFLTAHSLPRIIPYRFCRITRRDYLFVWTEMKVLSTESW